MQDQVGFYLSATLRIWSKLVVPNWKETWGRGKPVFSFLSFFFFVIAFPARPLLNESRFVRVFAGDRLVGRCRFLFFFSCTYRKGETYY